LSTRYDATGPRHPLERRTSELSLGDVVHNYMLLFAPDVPGKDAAKKAFLDAVERKEKNDKIVRASRLIGATLPICAVPDYLSVLVFWAPSLFFCLACSPYLLDFPQNTPGARPRLAPYSPKGTAGRLRFAGR